VVSKGLGQGEEQRNPGGPIIGTQDRILPDSGVRILVRPGTRIPVGSQEHSAIPQRSKARQEVRQLNRLGKPRGLVEKPLERYPTAGSL